MQVDNHSCSLIQEVSVTTLKGFLFGGAYCENFSSKREWKNKMQLKFKLGSVIKHFKAAQNNFQAFTC